MSEWVLNQSAWDPLNSIMSRLRVAFSANISAAFAFWKFWSWSVVLGNSFLVVLVVLLQTSLPLFLFGPIALVNSAIAWYQAQDAKGGGLCAGPATLPRKKTFHATETWTIEQDAGRRIKANQETGPMTDNSQTRKGANIPRVDMLQPKTTRRVGCWNVRTLYQTGKLAQVAKEMKSYPRDRCISNKMS